ncbi:MAG: DUF484 family protein [Alphaproteobacteria bacterium]
MTQEPKGKRETGLKAGDIAQWFRENPDFPTKHPELLAELAAPGRKLGRGVTDLQQAMIEKLRADLELARQRQSELVETGRANLASQSRIHECVQAMLAATSLEHLVQTVTTDFAVLLDVDVVALCIEADGANPLTPHIRGLQVIPAGAVATLLGDGRPVMLRSHVQGEADIYGGGAPLVVSDALARITVTPATPPGLIAFGSRQPGKFQAGQAVELFAFLARSLERVIRLWLAPPG